MPVVNERKKLIKKADGLVSLIVRQRDEYCVTCGSSEQLGCGHLHTRAAHSVRWDLENCHAQCWPCNYRHEFDPYPLSEYVRRKLGPEAYEALYERYRTPVKRGIVAMRELVENLKKLL